MIYTGLDVAKVDREFIRSMHREGLPLAKLPARRLARITVQLPRVFDLSDPAVLATLGVRPSEVMGDDVAVSQRLGAAAHHLGYEAILAPSATGHGMVLALFLDTRAAESVVEVASVDDAYTPQST